jgi:DNA damage-binding protein 1
MGAHLHLAAFLGSSIIALFSGALFVAYADYMNQTHERDLIRWERSRETWECENYLEGEQNEMIELYESKGMSKDDARTVITVISKYKELFVDIMMVQELGLLEPCWTPLEHGLATFVSFFLCGSITLIPGFFAMGHGRYYDPLPYSLFKSTLICAAMPLFCLAILKTYFTSGHSYWKLCASELVNPILVVFSAYYAASWLRVLF